jgi:hypothetical protein
MKKLILSITILATMLFSCSSSDDDDDNGNNPPNNTLIGHYSLRINGDGLNDELFTFDRDTIEGGNLGLKFTSSDNSSNSLFFALPNAQEGIQYSIAPYVNNTTSTSSIILSGNGVYLSVDGNVFINEIETNGDCATYKGNFTINYRRQDNTPGNINVQGSFEVPIASICD